MIPTKLIENTRRLLAEESGAVYKPRHGKLLFALGFPNVYRLGMSSLGFQLVYGLLNNIPDVACERVFLPEAEDVQTLQRTGSHLFTFESQTPVGEFDVLAFSISFEFDYVNMLQMLSLSGMPLLAAERDESHPLVIVGGPCATFNPEPIADFVDAFVVGEAEDAIGEIVDVIRAAGKHTRLELLQELAKIDGVYVPKFYSPVYAANGVMEAMEVAPGAPEKVIRRRTKSLDQHNATSVILTPNTEFADLTLVEVMRGCSRQCRFCVAGYMDLPPRPRKVDLSHGVSRLGLVGSAVFDHPDAQAICEQITGDGRAFTVSSTRVETLTQELAGLMRQGGQETITIAPEAGTERLRGVINKAMTDAEIMGAVEMANSAGFKRLKLYFMVGLPTETQEDIAAIGEMSSQIAAQFPSINVQVSASCYVPKPWTPFQWLPMATERELSSKIAVLRKSLAGNRRAHLSSESPRLSIVQGWLARGDRRLSAALVNAMEQGYARGIAEAGLDPAFYANRQREFTELLPWDHIDLGTRKEYLWREMEKAFEGKLTFPCNVPVCRRCGVC